MENKQVEIDFTCEAFEGLLICIGGFEARSVAFAKKLNKRNCKFEKVLIIRYESQKLDNEKNFLYLEEKLKKLIKKNIYHVSVSSDYPIKSIQRIKDRIKSISHILGNCQVLIDISGMTHLWATGVIHACLSRKMKTNIIYSEAKSYYPSERSKDKLIKAQNEYDFKTAAQYLQSKSLKSVQIHPHFSGNFRPGKSTCLIVFVGHEPNRIEGLVDQFAPGALMVIYGSSPHAHFKWRTKLSKDLHKNIFSDWRVRELEVSTFNIDQILELLEREFRVISDEYDIAIASQSSKMQAVASYIFWRRHPEIQLLFTSPVKFNPNQYSRGVGKIYSLGIGDEFY